mmetsp:Transcript_24483/g.51068  ORF Transcript_24483/g.51068 Transcript_24483/m.51068 type:complete len:152 (-) Transcript_24483:6940-7395(-)
MNRLLNEISFSSFLSEESPILQVVLQVDLGIRVAQPSQTARLESTALNDLNQDLIAPYDCVSIVYAAIVFVEPVPYIVQGVLVMLGGAIALLLTTYCVIIRGAAKAIPKRSFERNPFAWHLIPGQDINVSEWLIPPGLLFNHLMRGRHSCY